MLQAIHAKQLASIEIKQVLRAELCSDLYSVVGISENDDLQTERHEKLLKKRPADAGIDGFISGHSLRASGRQMEKLTDTRALCPRRDGRTRRNRKI